MYERESVTGGLPQHGGAGLADPAEPLSLPYHCVHQAFEAQAKEFPEAPALTFGDSTLTYGELNFRANQLAHYLRTLGVGPEILVGLCVERSVDTMVGMLAILKAGGAYVPLDVAYPQDRLAYMIRDARIPVIITRSELRPGLATHQLKVVSLDADRDRIGSEAGENPDSGVSADNLMYVIYTSGSTGKPKGVMVTHGNVARLFEATRPFLQFDAGDSWTLFHSCSFGFSVWEIWGALYHGARLVIVSQAVSQSTDDFYELVCRERITVLSQTPSAFSLFLLADAASKHEFGLSLRYIVFSGERLENQRLESWIKRHGDEQPRLVNMYAITETAGEITYQRITRKDLSESTRNVIGVPLPDVQIYILDEDGKQVPAGSPGEMYVGSSCVARGYLNLPELTAQKFLPNPFADGRQEGLYRTGDRARVLPNGEIEFLGRADDQVKIRGYRVELSEIQDVLTAHPAIQEAVVSTEQSETASQARLIAFIVPHGASPATADLQSYLKANLPEYMIPNSFVTLDRIPRSPNGKIDRQKLLSMKTPAETTPRYKPQTREEQALASLWALGAATEAPVIPLGGNPSPAKEIRNDDAQPGTSVEQTLAQIWKEVLGLNRIGLQDDFLELGGNSLLAAQVLHRTNDVFRVDLSTRHFFDAGTIGGLARLITQKQTDQLAPDELAGMLAELEEFSDEEARQLLANRAGEANSAGTGSLAALEIPASGTQHDRYMRLAIGKAKEAVREHQTPIAACVVKDGEVVACVHNSVRRDTDPTAHAEVLAIREACRKLETTDLSGCVLYSTLEPCPMCFSACTWANLSTVGYGARREDAVQIGLPKAGTSVQSLKTYLHSSVELVADILRHENLEVFELWNQARGARTSQYDRIAEQFKQVRNSPVNKHIVDHTLFSMIGDLDRGQSVLDLACGEGHYSRKLKRRGAALVTGVDISSQMIRLAEEQENSDPLGITYLCSDVLELGVIGQFDVVVAPFLLNYARTKEHLIDMCKIVCSNLKPGGHFIVLTENFNQSPEDFGGYERYGYSKSVAHPSGEGAVITYRMSTGSEELRFDGHYWSGASYSDAFETAGFKDIRTHNLSCSPEGIEEYGHRFWKTFLDNPPFIGVVCRK